MYSGPYGFPHKEVKPLPVKTKRKVSTDNMWVSVWEGQGLKSDISVEPKSWWTTPQIEAGVIEPTVVMEFEEPTNLTHIHMKSDTEFVDDWGISADQGAFYCEYSANGVTWTRLAYPCIGNGYYTKSGEFDDLDCYFWVPRTRIKARFWRIVVIEGFFTSSYLDDEWHISELNPGTLDHIKDDILIDVSLLRSSDDPDPYWVPLLTGLENYNNIQKGVGVGKVHHTNIQLDIMLIFRSENASSSLINTKYFWMDRHSMRYFAAAYDETNSYNMAISLLLHNGFVSNISTIGNDIWDAAHQFTTINLFKEDYLGLGWANNLQKGVSCTRAAKDDNKSVPNTLGAIPDCMWILSGGVQHGLTHPSDPYVIHRCEQKNFTETVAEINGRDIVFSAEIITGIASGVILFTESAEFFQSGQYTGDGNINNFISTPDITPKIIVVKRLPNGDTGTYMLISSIDSDSGDTWEVSGFNDKLVPGEGIIVSSTGFTLQDGAQNKNALGETYLWWAWA